MSKQHQYYVYIMTNEWHNVLYTGVTNNLVSRVYQHREKKESAFTTRYHVTKLVFYEEYTDIAEAVAREKQIKAGSRKKKIDLIQKNNPKWKDLSEGF